MKILIFNWRDLKHSWSGGGEIYIFEQAKRWVKLGHSVTLFCGEDIEKKLPESEFIDGIKIFRKGSRYTVYLWAFWYYFTKLKGKYDLLIDVVNGIPFFTPFYSRLPKLGYVYHVHESQFFYELPFPISYIGYFIEKYLFPAVYLRTKIIAISQTTKNQLIKYGFSRNNIRIVYCGINGNVKSSNHQSKFTHPTLLYLGRIKKYKRVDLLVDLFPKIIERVPDARLIIAGWGTEASKVTDTIMKSPLRRKISLMGPVSPSEKRALLSKSWIFINPSIGEGWSIAVIEANLYGTPAVSFEVPGLAESIQSGKTGFLAKDEDDLIEKICKILNNKKLRDRLSHNALLWANNFDWDKTAKKSLLLANKVRHQNKHWI